MLFYLLLALSFAISSYFFIHRPALKEARMPNTNTYALSYLLVSFTLFPVVFYAWVVDRKTLIKELYNGHISI